MRKKSPLEKVKEKKTERESWTGLLSVASFESINKKLDSFEKELKHIRSLLEALHHRHEQPMGGTYTDSSWGSGPIPDDEIPF